MNNFDKKSAKNYKSFNNLNQVPVLNEQMHTLFEWLKENRLAHESFGLETYSTNAVDYYRPENLIDRVSIVKEKDSWTKTQNQIRDEKKSNISRDAELSDVLTEDVWKIQQNPENYVRRLDWNKCPADMMAFYRPFHELPSEDWGIYLLIEPLLKYHEHLHEQHITANINSFPPQVLMHLILFEIFHHEFFHHLAESTATSLEIVLAAQQKFFQPIYLQHQKQQRQKAFTDYPHQPLEEALANAYAYNSLSFISRTKVGYRTATVQYYQAAIKHYWDLEPPGYRHAAYYINSKYVSGAAHFLAQMLDQPGAVHHTPLSCLAKHVMPKGHSALVQKANVPTYLVGKADEINKLYELVPNPIAAYTNLFWPYDTKKIDEYLQKQMKKSTLQVKRKP